MGSWHAALWSISNFALRVKEDGYIQRMGEGAAEISQFKKRALELLTESLRKSDDSADLLGVSYGVHYTQYRFSEIISFGVLNTRCRKAQQCTYLGG